MYNPNQRISYIPRRVADHVHTQKQPPKTQNLGGILDLIYCYIWFTKDNTSPYIQDLFFPTISA